MAGENLLEIKDDNFEAEVLKSDIPVLVDIWAPWCGPCRIVGPIIEELANEYAGKMKVGKLNVDDNSETAMKYQIQSIPTILIFKGGQEVQRLIGARPKPAFKKEIDAVI
ncbi:thioredoxin [Candidatus Poribacteria bacterium]|nr:thioredoxin [Candidatus Poribacteria bacterium]